MEKLARGVHTFQNKYFARNRELFQHLAEAGQRPETLFITCSDARIVPSLITSTGPGELFIIRNVGNVVPQLSLAGGTVAAIEYALEALNVPNVVVCGHTHCGAIRAILDPSSMDRLPHVRRWLTQTERVRAIVEQRYSGLDEAARAVAAVEENVLVQLENLRSIPFVADRLAAGKLLMSGWVFKIETGQVFDYDPELGEFVPLVASRKSNPPPTGPAKV